MPDPSTTRLGLYKSKSDGSELVNYTQDIGQNLDKIDTAVGFQIVTSSTRPSSPYPGKPIAESDTNRTYYSNGSSPASGSWVEIPNSAGTFGGPLTLGSTLAVAGAANLNGGFTVSGSSGASVAATTSTTAWRAKTPSDALDRWSVTGDGTILWGDGTAARDTNLYRSGVNTLKTDDALVVGMGITVGSTAWTTYTPAVGNGGTATWTTRTGYYWKLGKVVFVCIYLVVNAAGSGTNGVAVDLPSNPDRSTRQALTIHAETIGVGGTAGGTIRGGEAVWYPGGVGATSDRMRVDDSDGDGENNILGADLKAGGTITIQGWYREA
ncbi:hypothetical protein [Streptomyces sp. NRRL S-813]|uniref:hypothetical protein n=1 Tax=Streptomyces sp. NRRL S-813 TaxID=1463919 RepID=UPI0004BFBEBC|nr:hypothetical protein [Streptomyces sp. NRRL S-813]